VLLSVSKDGATRAFISLNLGELNDIKRWLLRSSLLGWPIYLVGLLVLYSEMDFREGYDPYTTYSTK
jgi:hypothetical protein